MGTVTGAEALAAVVDLGPVWLFFAREGVVEAGTVSAPAILLTVLVLRGERTMLVVVLVGFAKPEAELLKVTFDFRRAVPVRSIVLVFVFIFVFSRPLVEIAGEL